MMHFTCDSCGEKIESGNPNSVDFPIHVLEVARGHVNGYVDGNGNPVSGRTVRFDLCNSCFNVAFNASMITIQAIQKSSEFEPSQETDLR